MLKRFHHRRTKRLSIGYIEKPPDYARTWMSYFTQSSSAKLDRLVSCPSVVLFCTGVGAMQKYWIAGSSSMELQLSFGREVTTSSGVVRKGRSASMSIGSSLSS